MPTHNETNNLLRVIPEVRRATPDYDLPVENDGSQDETAHVATDMAPEVVNPPANL